MSEAVWEKEMDVNVCVHWTSTHCRRPEHSPSTPQHCTGVDNTLGFPSSHSSSSIQEPQAPYKTNKILKEEKERGSLFSPLCCCPSSRTIIHTWEKLASLGETCNKEQPQSILNTGNRLETSHRYINYQVNWSQHIGHIIDNLQMGACQSSTTTPMHTPGSARLLQTDMHNSEVK